MESPAVSNIEKREEEIKICSDAIDAFEAKKITWEEVLNERSRYNPGVIYQWALGHLSALKESGVIGDNDPVWDETLKLGEIEEKVREALQKDETTLGELRQIGVDYFERVKKIFEKTQ